MQAFFSSQYALLWALVLAAALFYPVRQLIWTLAVRRAVSKGQEVDEEKSITLKRRASFTSILLCLVFSIAYTTSTMQDGG